MWHLLNLREGSLLAFILADKIGRLRTVQVSCLVWILGTAIWITSNGSVGQTLGGRFIAGLGVGAFPVVCPTFLAEVAPRTVRGLAVSIFSSSVYLGIVIGKYGMKACLTKIIFPPFRVRCHNWLSKRFR